MKDITASAWIIPIAELKEEIQRSAHITRTATVYSYRRRPSDLLLLFYFCQFHTLWPLVNCWGFSVREKPLYLLRICWLPQVLVTYIVPNLGRGDILLFAPPRSYLGSSACAVCLLISCRWTAVYPNSLLPCNLITNKENISHFPHFLGSIFHGFVVLFFGWFDLFFDIKRIQ